MQVCSYVSRRCCNWLEGVFTESHLIGYYCCVTSQDLPAYGTPDRTVSDLFRTPLGQQLPALVFVGASIAITSYRIRHQRDLLAIVSIVLGANLLYAILDILLTGIGWSISTWMHGPEQTAYTSLERRVYGIALHAGL